MFLTLKILRTVLKNLMLPPASSMLLAFLGVARRSLAPRLGRLLVLIGVGSIWLMSTPIIADQLAIWAEHYPPLNLDLPTDAQAIVILGGGGQRALAPEYGGPEVDPYLLERVTFGAYVAQKTGLPVLVTGFGIEAVAMRESLKRHFNIEARWVDDRSYDTFENAQNSARILKSAGIQRTILVTRATHLWRSVHEFEAAGIAVVPAPAGSFAVRQPGLYRYLPDTDALSRSHAAIYEVAGELVRELLATTHLRRH
jgi:uncharacterized SAM-binding protein YcdF (DUF218 family)